MLSLLMLSLLALSFLARSLLAPQALNRNLQPASPETTPDSPWLPPTAAPAPMPPKTTVE
jgi:hypothetical protein